MNADVCACYRHEDFAYTRGLMLHYGGEPIPPQDHGSIHAGPAGDQVDAREVAEIARVNGALGGKPRKGPIVCKVCNERREHHAKGLCTRCYKSDGKVGKPYQRKGDLTPPHAALAAAMKAFRFTYKSLGAVLGVDEKTLYRRLREPTREWCEHYRAAVLALGADDLLRFVDGPKGRAP